MTEETVLDLFVEQINEVASEIELTDEEIAQLQGFFDQAMQGNPRGFARLKEFLQQKDAWTDQLEEFTQTILGVLEAEDEEPESERSQRPRQRRERQPRQRRERHSSAAAEPGLVARLKEEGPLQVPLWTWVGAVGAIVFLVIALVLFLFATPPGVGEETTEEQPQPVVQPTTQPTENVVIEQPQGFETAPQAEDPTEGFTFDQFTGQEEPLTVAIDEDSQVGLGKEVPLPLSRLPSNLGWFLFLVPLLWIFRNARLEALERGEYEDFKILLVTLAVWMLIRIFGAGLAPLISTWAQRLTGQPISFSEVELRLIATAIAMFGCSIAAYAGDWDLTPMSVGFFALGYLEKVTLSNPGVGLAEILIAVGAILMIVEIGRQGGLSAATVTIVGGTIALAVGIATAYLVRLGLETVLARGLPIPTESLIRLLPELRFGVFALVGYGIMQLIPSRSGGGSAPERIEQLRPAFESYGFDVGLLWVQIVGIAAIIVFL